MLVDAKHQQKLRVMYQVKKYMLVSTELQYDENFGKEIPVMTFELQEVN